MLSLAYKRLPHTVYILICVPFNTNKAINCHIFLNLRKCSLIAEFSCTKLTNFSKILKTFNETSYFSKGKQIQQFRSDLLMTQKNNRGHASRAK